MGEIKKTIEICDEDIMNLIDCLEKTTKYWVPFDDLWPFTLHHIIDEFKKQLTPEEIEIAKKETGIDLEKYIG